MAWTLPLQLLHFGSAHFFALVADLLATPLLAPLTLSAMGLALASLVLPAAVLQLLPWLLPDGARWRRIGLAPIVMAVLVQGRVQLADGVVAVQGGRQQ